MNEIRLANINDLDSIISLFRQSEEKHSQNRPDVFSVANATDVLKTFNTFLTDPNVCNLVIESQGTLVAYLRYRTSVFPNISFLTQKNQPRCYIEEIIVDKKSRRQGLAKKLLLYVEHEMKAKEIHFIHLHVFSFNENAKALYESFGFKALTIELSKNLAN